MTYCQACGAPFVPRHKRHVFCSPTCKRFVHNRRYYERNRERVKQRVYDRRGFGPGSVPRWRE